MTRSPILEIIDFVDEIITGTSSAQHNAMVLGSYTSFFGIFLLIWRFYSDQDFSFVLTLSNGAQTAAFFLLLHKMRSQKSAAGISSKALQMYVLVFTFRLTSTLVKNGYLPVDEIGNWAYQACDIASLLLVLQLLCFTHRRFKHTYQEDLDSMPIWKFVPCAMMFGYFFYGHLNHSIFFDRVWAMSTNLDTIAMLPQLWMLVAKGGEVEALTSHFVAMIFFSRVLAWTFWYRGYPELAPVNGGFNSVGYVVIAAHTLQLLFSADFMYHYFQWTSGKFGPKSRPMVLPMGVVHDI